MLIVDADEVVIPELADEIARRICAERGGRLLSELAILFSRPANPALRLFFVLEPAIVQASTGPIREDTRLAPADAPATTRPTSTSSSTGASSALSNAARTPRLPDNRRLGRETQPLRHLGGCGERAILQTADPPIHRRAYSASNADSRRSPGGFPCVRLSASSTRTSCDSGSWTVDLDSTSAVSWLSTTFWRPPTDTSKEYAQDTANRIVPVSRLR